MGEEENAQEAASHEESRLISYGEKAVGLTFNPSGDTDVQIIKEAYAEIIDLLYAQKYQSTSGEMARLYSIAITEAQAAQMWAVKAITWKD